MRLKSKSPRTDSIQESSYGVKPLRHQELCTTVFAMMSDDLSERVRRRLREEMTRRDLSQQDVADLVKWTQSKVAQKLTGRTPITLEELEALCFGVTLSPVEAVRDHGLEFCADLTPTELRILEHLRHIPQAERDAFLVVLRVKTRTNAPERHARPLKKRKPDSRA